MSDSSRTERVDHFDKHSTYFSACETKMLAPVPKALLHRGVLAMFGYHTQYR
jgi:hypothetical protein